MSAESRRDRREIDCLSFVSEAISHSLPKVERTEKKNYFIAIGDHPEKRKATLLAAHHQNQPLHLYPP